MPFKANFRRRARDRINAISASFNQQAINFVHDPQWIIPSIVAPFMFTLVILMIHPTVDGPVALRAILGGGVLGMWGNTIFESSESIMYDRRNGTLEPIMTALAGLNDIILGRSLWNALVGLLNGICVLITAELLFGTSIGIADPLLFFLSMAMTLISLAAIGMLFSTLFVYTRRGYILSSMLEYPIYVLSGALVPIMLLPESARVFSFLLAPAWGVDAMNIAADPNYGHAIFGSAFISLGILLAISLLYYLVSTVLLWKVERDIRVSGTAVKF